MNIEQKRVPIIAFDGNHRVGKGTQIDLLSTSLADRNIQPIVLRGDGSRPGLGDNESDPYSKWWQQFKQYVEEFTNPYDAWRAGARRLLGEAACRISSLDDSTETIILFDRARISRTQMTLKEGLSTEFEVMYRNEADDQYDDSILRTLKPDLTVYMHANINTLLGRLSTQDPKYEFRRENIINSKEIFQEAFELCHNNGENVVDIRADQDPADIALEVKDVILLHKLL